MRKKIIVLLCMLLMVLLGGCGNKKATLPEKMLSMKWKEITDLSVKDFRDMLDKEGALYIATYGDLDDGVYTTTTDSFFGYDCIYGFGFADLDIDRMEKNDGLNIIYPYAFNFAVAFENEDQFKEGKKTIESYLQNNLEKNLAVMKGESSDFFQGSVYSAYLLEQTDQDMDKFDNCYQYAGIEKPDEEEETINDSLYSMYKFVNVIFYHLPDSDEEEFYSLFPSNKSYSNNICLIECFFAKMTEEECVKYFASNFQYDFILKKEIVIEDWLKKADMGDLLKEKSSDKNELIPIYFMKEHHYDMYENCYIKSEEEQKAWYVKYFDWDIEFNSKIDMSDYDYDPMIYCAINFHYNLDTKSSFESDFDCALYLAKEENYNIDAKKKFKDEEEKQLWFLLNYAYDIETKTYLELDKDVAEAILSYQNYIDTTLNTDKRTKYSFIYLDDDNIPECIVWLNPIESYYYGIYYTEICVISYKNRTVQSFHSELNLADDIYFYYTPKTGMFCVTGMIGIRHTMEYEKMEFKEQFTKIDEGWTEGEPFYFDFEEHLSVQEDASSSILTAYHALEK